MSIREKFVERFGEAAARQLEAAAEEHKNGIHDDPGSDPFKWVLCMIIGYECAECFSDYHNIRVPWAELKQWIKDHAELDSHDGDCDYVALLAGCYDEYVKGKTYGTH